MQAKAVSGSVISAEDFVTRPELGKNDAVPGIKIVVPQGSLPAKVNCFEVRSFTRLQVYVVAQMTA
jgi:hypothetical protein